MNMNQLINMMIRMVMQKLMNFGIRKGTQLAAGKGKPAAEMTPAERKAARDMRAAVKRARQAARITRRIR